MWQACLEGQHPGWRHVSPRLLMQQVRRVPMLVAAVCLAILSRPGEGNRSTPPLSSSLPRSLVSAHAAALIAPFSLGRSYKGYTTAEFALLGLSAALVAVAVAPSLFGSRKAAAPKTKFAHVAIGSTNACKCAAVRQTLLDFPTVVPRGAPLMSFSVPSGVSEQPIGLPTIADGARNRAVAAHAAAGNSVDAGADAPPLLAFGIESGLFEACRARARRTRASCWPCLGSGA